MARDHDDEPDTMTEKSVASLLAELILEQPDLGDVPLDSVSSFEDAEILTRNQGFVLRFGDGSEFQITIVRSR